MTTAECIAHYLESPCLNEDGEDNGTKLLPPLSDAELDELQKLYGCTFSTDVEELLRYCGGLEEGPMEFIEFKGSDADFVPPTLRGRFRTIALDGFGNFWFYWTTHVGPELGPIFYYQHEGPMLFYQADGIADFVRECIRFMTPPYASLIDDVHEFRIRPLRTLNDDLLNREAVNAQADQRLIDFAEPLPDDTLIYDFQNSKVGDGIDLAKFDVVALHSTLPILGLRRRKSFWEKLLVLFKPRHH